MVRRHVQACRGVVGHRVVVRNWTASRGVTVPSMMLNWLDRMVAPGGGVDNASVGRR
jgi:hypothetical protein